MPIPESSARAIRDLPSLLRFLERDLQWKLPSSPTLEEVTFEWSASELRLNEAAQSKLSGGSVLQLRPMTPDQPWGIFIVNFTDGQVYKTALRQVLRGLVPRRRRDSKLPAWKHENLLFICTTKEQEFTFAHFRGEKPERAKLVRFSWSPGEPIRTLCEFNLPALKMPEDPSNREQWVAEWTKAFDVEAVTKRFYQEIANWYFWACENVVFPMPKYEKHPEAYIPQSLIRLITRLIFCWFVKQMGLIPRELFDLRALSTLLKDGAKLPASKATIFYKAILQNLFFATLNQEINKRQFRKRNKDPHGRDPHHGITNLYRYEDLFTDPKTFLRLVEHIPFLNGGLFECLDRAEENIRIDGFSDHPKNPLYVPDFLFFGEERTVDLSKAYGEPKYKRATVRGLIHIFNRYNFTVTESTPLDQEVALDPELAGKVFENLLAAYNPETATTARKATGSYYTPREIVDYMVDESLIAYLKSKLSDLTPNPSPLERGDFDPSSKESRAVGSGLSPSRENGDMSPRYMTTDVETWRHLKPLARELRREQTEAEEILWQHLRNKQLGVRFRRQHAIGEFIVDFVCIERRLVVEVDGEVHKEQKDYDQERTRILESRGFRVIRFWNHEVIKKMDHVLTSIKSALTVPLPFGEGSGVGSETQAKATTNDFEGRLRHLLSYNDEPHQFSPAEVKTLIEAIDNLKALDPACGSGAFPMGLLHKLVHILGKLDPRNEQWKQRQIARVRDAMAAAERIEDATIRERTLNELERQIESIEDAFARDELDYGRKLYLIENCIYGVDIQPIAVQIAKMRFFISLTVDQKVDPTKPNLGIRPLPNLETKFVAANTLIGVDRPASQTNLFADQKVLELMQELVDIRHQMFTAKTPQRKQRLRERDDDLRTAMAAQIKTAFVQATEKEQQKIRHALEEAKSKLEEERAKPPELRIQRFVNLFGEVEETRTDLSKERIQKIGSRMKELEAQLRHSTKVVKEIDSIVHQLANWNPYDQNASADFFDPEWMFGNRDGFDIVIGNPPYGVQISATEMERIATRLRDTKNLNSAAIFIDVAKNTLIHRCGVVSFVVPKSLLYSERWFSLVKALAPNTSGLVDLEQGFENVLLEQVVFVFRQSQSISGYRAFKFSGTEFINRAVVPVSCVSHFRTWPCDVDDVELRLGTKISNSGMFLRDVSKSFRGFGLQQKLAPTGKYRVIGGRNILRYGISGHKGFVRQSDLDSVAKKVSVLLQPKVISQQIVAHIQNPRPHIMIIASVDPTGEVLGLDTVENTVPISGAIHLNMIAALFNSTLINWYAYRFIYCGAVRTMHFDDHYIGKIPLPSDYQAKQQPIIALVDKILSAKRANPNADVSALEREIDQRVYKLYGLTAEEIKIVEEGGK